MSKKKNVIEAIYPLSPMQQGLLFHTLHDPGSGVYVEQLSCTLRGDLNVPAFQRAWQSVLDRHSILRTAFIWDRRDEPFQMVYQHVRLPWEQQDWRDLSPAEYEGRIETFLKEERICGFKLSTAPLLRLALFQLSATTYQFVWSHHHLLLDGWSLPLILKEVFACYAAFALGHPLLLAPPRPYRDYIAWLQHQDLARAEAFWRATLQNFSAPTSLGLHKRGPAQAGARYAKQQLQLNPPSTAALHSLGRQQALTLNTLVQGAWALLLSRYSGSDDVLFGVTVAGRPASLPGVEQMVGLFINTLPLRVRLAPHARLLDWLAELQAQQVELRQYEYTPLVQIQRWSALPHGVPLFESIVVFENYPVDDAVQEQGGRLHLMIENVRIVEQTNYPLLVTAVPRPLLQVEVSYDCRRFDNATIARMLGHIQMLLDGIAAQSAQCLADLPLLTDAERRQLLVDWNATAAAYPHDQCIHQLFEAQVAATLDAIAVVFHRSPTTDHRPTTNDRSPLHPFTPSPLHPFTCQLTYQELNRRANQLAHYLQTLGVGPEVRVGICVERSMEFVVGLLGILKAGGAYVPLDPTYPQARLAFMIEDAQAPMLLTLQQIYDVRFTTYDLEESGSAIVNRKSKIVNPLVVCLDRVWETIASASVENLDSKVRPENAAYAIYTSGSTGQPKGAIIRHQALVNYALEIARQFGLCNHDRFLQFASLSFDVVVEELYPTWLSGAAVVLHGTGLLAPGAEFMDLLAQAQVTAVELPSAYWHAWVDELARSGDGMPAALRLVILGSEKPLPERLAAWQRFGIPLIYVYGLTETTVTSTLYKPPMCRENGTAWFELPIGRPVANTQIYVLDVDLQPVPIGVAGELYIGGVGLARGYLGRPDLTAERFIPNPFAEGMGDGGWGMEDASPSPIPHPPSPGTRLYKTGDLARYRPDGNIEFLGRTDQQVKVRGYRVELGEIETALQQHPAVREVVVIVREDLSGDTRLVAYVVPKIEDRRLKIEDSNVGSSERLSSIFYPLSSELRDFLKQKLPDYMVPSAFVQLDALPLTPNGKIDRRALPAPDHTSPALEDGYVAPRTPVEAVLAQIWADVLRVEQVGVYDSFFALGGHSLLAIRIISRVRDAFLVELPLRGLFEAPTVRGVAEQIELTRQDGQHIPPPPLQPIPRDSALPLSYAQQRLWFLDQLQPDSRAYNVPAAVRLTGPLDIVALAWSLRMVVRRHEALRTTITTVDGRPVQVIGAARAVPLPLLDLQALSADARETAARQLASAEAQRPFDLSRGPLLRVTLLRLGAAAHVALLTMHHIVSDEWSMEVLIREITALYAASTTAQPASLPALPIQYADYAIWQRAWLQDVELGAQLAYWQAQLADLPVLQLPADHPRPAVPTFHGASHEIVPSQALSTGLQALSRREGVTLFMTLLAAFQVLLGRYSGQDDIAVGTPIANRTRGETEGLIGYFLNTLVLRTDLAGAPTFRELLKRVRTICLDAYAHQDLPFEHLVEALSPERDLSRNPLFDVLFNFANTSQMAFELPGLTLTGLKLAEPEAKFALTFYVEERGGALRFELVYQRALFSAEHIACILEHLCHLLGQIVAAPDRSIRSYSLVTPGSRPLLPDPSVALSEPHYDMVPKMVTDWARCAPAQTAVCQGERAWTYATLANRATALARELAARGLTRGDVVAVYGPRSFGLIASMLGTLIGGGVLLPVDRLLPAERQRHMLREAGVAHLFYVGERRLEDAWLRELPALMILGVDSDTGQLDTPRRIAQPGVRSLPDLSPDDRAYLFFTSGSTGAPKGVLGCHKGLSHFLTWQREMFAVGPRDRCANLTGLSFDVVLRDVFLPLTSGATLCLPEEDDDLGRDRTLRWLEYQQISLLHTVPALIQTWLTYPSPALELRALRWVFFAGEPLPESLVRRWRAAFPAAGGVANLYGPTETTLAKCCYVVPADPPPGVQPIGWPLPNTQALVLEGDRLCGIGEPGEIVLRTPFRSLGYINAPHDQQRFIRNPFGGDEGDVLYRTGDCGRYRLDGALDILGRLDHQIKIRGLRVEPDEVMALLLQHPAVRAGVVVVQQDAHDQPCLVAYVVMAPQEQLSIPTLRSHLSRHLPTAMVPTAFVALDALPLTLNGKVDRRALPVLDLARPELEEPLVAPRTPVEDVLTQLWADVLGVERVGIHDNFFDLGGHSLLTTQIISRIRGTFQLELPLHRLFETPTVAGLAECIEIARRVEQDALPPPLRPLARAGTLPLSYAQERLWFLAQLQPDTLAYSIPAAVRMTGPLDVAALQRSLSEIVRRHEVLRTTFATVDGQPILVIAPPRAVPLPLLDLRSLPEGEREAATERLATAECQRPFDLSHGPLLRVTLLRPGEAEHVVLLIMHHIVSDGWSMEVFIRELTRLYAADVTGQPTTLAELPIQYADYAAWQRDWLQGAVLERQLAYWRAQLADLPVLELPTDQLRPAVVTFQGATQNFALPPVLGMELAALSRREQVTLFMTLLAAFQVLLARYSAQDDIAVGTPIAGRTWRETEGLIGCFVNTFVLRADLSGHLTFRELLKRVRAGCLDAYAHQDLPFEQVVEALQPARDLSRNPLFQVMFVLEHAPLATPDLPGLTLHPLKVSYGTTQFDLNLTLVQGGSGLTGSMTYHTDLFDALMIARLLGHFQTLLEGIVSNPEQRLAHLPLLMNTERQQIAVWNATMAAYPHDLCIHQLFEAQVTRTPDAVALVFDGPPTTDHRPPTNGETRRHGDKETRLNAETQIPTPNTQHPTPNTQHLTYRELNARANRLARYLRGRGMGPEMRIGICMERSLELAVSLLGILKAGGAYMLLDPAYPLERLVFMLDDAQAPMLLTQKAIYDLRLTIDDLEESGSGIVHRKSKIVNPLVVCLDADWDRIDRMGGEDLASEAQPTHPAYVIYTSGSTGQPKGVLITHQALVNYTLAIIPRFGLQASDRVLQFAPLSFDVVVEELFPTWVSGATVVLRTEEPPAPTDDFLRLLAQAQVTAIELPANYWHAWVDDLMRSRAPVPASLRLMIVGCEKPSPDRLATWRQFSIPLIYVYGLSETTVTSTMYHLPQSGAASLVLPIGRPIANTQTYVLDAQLQPLPVGVPGELYIGGEGLARGYLDRPDLTAERFVPNPFAGVLGDRCWVTEDAAPNTQHLSPNTRLYKTGDVVRYRRDGNLEFLGRRDEQVKVRGFRIELGEVESVLAQHPDVREAVVLAHADGPGDKRLVAYVVPTNDQRPTTNDQRVSMSDSSSVLSPQSSVLRTFLTKRLPDYMVPATFVLLDALPLTRNGKIDRHELLALDVVWSASDDAFVAPRTPVEEVLASIWADVLRLERVGVRDNFFALGGHSLLAMQVISRVRDAFQAELSLRSLFEAPTVEGLAERIASARGDAIDVLPPLLRPVAREGTSSTHSTSSGQASSGQAGSGGGLPLSFAQQRLWFFDQLQPHSAAYNVPAAVRLAGALDVIALQHSLTAIIERHEVLRTTFVTLHGQPAQVIAMVHVVPLPLLDLQAFPAHERETAARRLARAETQRPFDLARGPLLRVTLLRLADAEHVVLLTMHHIVADAWSIGVLIREVGMLYGAFATGQPAALPELPIQYADYAVWQRSWLQDAVLEAQLAYWRTQLADLPMLQLPTDHARPAVSTFQGASHDIVLPSALRTGLLALSRREGGTLFMTLLATFQALLARYSGQDDIAVGTPIANRTRAETEHLIGCFLNTLVLRTDLAGAPSFRALLKQVRAVCLDAYAHQDLPFEQVVEALQPARDLNRHPLFQVMLTLEHASMVALDLPGLTLRPLDVTHGMVKFDLSLSFEETGAELAGVLRYSNDLFETATIERMLGHLQTLLEGIVANPDRRLTELPLLTDAERQQLLVDWNPTTAPDPLDRCIHQFFEAQAARTPDAVAVVFHGSMTRGQGSGVRGQETTPLPPPARGGTGGGRRLSPQSSVLSPQSLTYDELNARANQLAHYLQALGVRPEIRVAICMERSVELVIGLLGVLKSGGAYVPLDPTYPPERLAFMLEDSQVPVLLTQQRLRDRLPHLSIVNPVVLCLDADRAGIAQSNSENPTSDVTAWHLAYLIYTSGTTGRPKAVMVEHGGLVNTLCASQAKYQFTERDRIPYLLSFSFDIALFQLLSSLLVGGASVIVSEHLVLDFPRLSMVVQQLTFLHATPSLLRPIVDFIQATERPDRYHSIRQVAVGGDTIPPVLLQDMQRVFPSAQIYIGYGPTEGTIMCTNYAVPRDVLLQNHIIGKPLRNMQIRLYDPYQNLVPIGIAGELYIGGPSVARGYLHRPDLTAERFVPNPFLKDEGKRMKDESTAFILHPSSFRLYKTGDLARYLPDGNIEFLGRIDQQVKVRGFRIELGEIEMVLAQHPAVRECVVVAREDAPGDKRLVAYVVTSDELQVTSSQDSLLVTRHSSLVTELRAFLAAKLPDYMVPADIVSLERLPLTPNGKIDRRALPPPDRGRPALDDTFVAPSTPVEELLAGIWADVLGLEQVGVQDNFFALGGHSLLATQLISRVRQIFQVELPLRKLFEAPVITALADQIAAAQRDTQGLRQPPLHPIPRDRPLPLSYAQQRLWFLDRLQPDNPAYNIPMAMRLTGPLDVAALRQSLSGIVGRHEVLRTTFVTVDGQPAQLIAPAQIVPLPLIDLQTLPETEREDVALRLATAEARQPFNLTRGPLVRATLLRLGVSAHVVLLTLHHIVADGWSAGVFTWELVTLYTARAAGQPAPLPELPIQYADYAVWQRTWLQGLGVRGQGATTPLPPPAGGGTEGGAETGQGSGGHHPLPPPAGGGTEGGAETGQGSGGHHPLPPPAGGGTEGGAETGQGSGGHHPLPPPAGGGTEGGAETRRQGDGEMGSRERPSPDPQSPVPNPQSPLQAHLAYWRQRLADFPILQLPTDRPRPAVETFRGTDCTFMLPAALATRLVALSRAEGVTLFMTLLAAFQGLLARYSDQDDIVVGTPIANRTRAEIENLIGCFVNTLVLRTDLSGNPTAREALARAREVCLGAYTHQELPFEQVVEALQPTRDLSRNPLFQVMFGLQNAPLPTMELPNLTVRSLAIKPETAKFDLSLFIEEAGAGSIGTLEYNTNLFDAATITRMIGHFQTLLEGIVADPDRRLMDVSLLTQAERRQMLVDWNTPQGEFRSQESGVRSDTTCIHHLFEVQVARMPNAIAVLYAGAGDRGLGTGDWETAPTPNPQSPIPNPQLTYAELNARANQLAYYLQTLGVGPEVRVGLCLERSLELVIGLLGTLKAGGAYVPLDPAYPVERLAFMFADSQARVLLTQKPIYDLRFRIDDLEESWPVIVNRKSKIVNLDADWPSIARRRADLAIAVRADNLAYVIYTSGSTGTPKGVAIAHHSAVGLLGWARTVFAAEQLAGVLAATSICFDLSVFELFTPLSWGGTVILADNVLQLPVLPAAQAVTLINTVPSAIAELLRGDLPGAARTVALAGEPLPQRLVRQLYQQAQVEQVVNLYGPSEDTTYSTYALIPKAADCAPTIGRPIANTQVYLLDRQQQPVPIGIAGEIYLGGAGLARGYLGRPDLTAERFIPNPFWGMGDGGWGMEDFPPIPHPPSPIPRLYRTGDLARYRPDGSIEFLGRTDHQVKIRGYRIELGEIEAVLDRHPGVRDIVVVAREDAPGEKRLVAYVVPKIEDRRLKIEDSNLGSSERLSSIFYPLSSELRTFLQQHLPDYMVPSAFVQLDALPRTPNGKVDRRALPIPDATQLHLAEAYVAPRNPVEELVASIWADVLGLEQIGIHDNFFTLGGHSLLATQVIARTREVCRVELPLRSLFEAPTVAELAEYIAVVLWARQDPQTLPDPKLGDDEEDEI